MTTLTELFSKNDMSKLKQEFTLLVEWKYSKTIDTLLHCNPNILLFITRKLNEKIQCD